MQEQDQMTSQQQEASNENHATKSNSATVKKQILSLGETPLGEESQESSRAALPANTLGSIAVDLASVLATARLLGQRYTNDRFMRAGCGAIGASLAWLYGPGIKEEIAFYIAKAFSKEEASLAENDELVETSGNVILGTLATGVTAGMYKELKSELKHFKIATILQKPSLDSLLNLSAVGVLGTTFLLPDRQENTWSLMPSYTREHKERLFFTLGVGCLPAAYGPKFLQAVGKHLVPREDQENLTKIYSRAVPFVVAAGIVGPYTYRALSPYFSVEKSSVDKKR